MKIVIMCIKYDWNVKKFFMILTKQFLTITITLLKYNFMCFKEGRCFKKK